MGRRLVLVQTTDMVNEAQIEYGFVGKLQGLKYTYRPDIRNRESLDANFR